MLGVRCLKKQWRYFRRRMSCLVVLAAVMSIWTAMFILFNIAGVVTSIDLQTHVTWQFKVGGHRNFWAVSPLFGIYSLLGKEVFQRMIFNKHTLSRDKKHLILQKTHHNQNTSNNLSTNNSATEILFIGTDLLEKPLDNFRYPFPHAFHEATEKTMGYCHDAFVGYLHEFAYLRKVSVDLGHGRGARGGEDIKKVINQDEAEEFYFLTKGFFNIPCKAKPLYRFRPGNNYLNEWLRGTAFSEKHIHANETIPGLTIALMRFEYANLYHTMTNWYNVFSTMVFFNRTASDTNILLIDGHPEGALDDAWQVLFSKVMRVGHLKPTTLFTEMAWCMMGYNSPLLSNFPSQSPPLIPEFRHFFLTQYGIRSNIRTDCAKISILFIWRRNYVAHPRNPDGVITRKILNEQSLISLAKATFPQFLVQAVQLDTLSMLQQLWLVSNTSILIGMHGAGLTHTLFQPLGGTTIELFNEDWGENRHLESLAVWSKMHYLTWRNTMFKNEVKGDIFVPPEAVVSLIYDALMRMGCESRT